ncbi:Anhydro-N-acetylmuramic acid kinase [Rhodothermus marinus SG0.5JP17-172]|uniref:anhydro-N-acetylmuramic acid kinase n=1 Tax=Rhodothermus marinus TaxID=29549 RepID=UPI000223DDA4|nr:anhydro-N-acetylmuramic acid kinase [Rhodothermus marinus]AEN72742.1 Anhydro-N-acetylmuramic acid kinase [Rhodothermus marinus SG0.5JP17-172]MBO2490589.1 anhydro-N-acetylmuramic acid kinase [Rhodothermus marinus]
MSIPERWQRLWRSTGRHVVGLMSGTSLDGIDAALVYLEGSGRNLHLTLEAFIHRPFPEALRTLLLRNSLPETSSVRELALLNARLAQLYAEAVEAVLEQAGRPREALDLVGVHGQTVHHIPESTECAGAAVTTTLQIGDPSVLANLLGVPVVGDFRQADMALGGQGAPLVPYFDYVYFTHPTETRGLLNIGGIANLTVLPADARPEDVRAFDTGPGNMLIDALAQRLFGTPYDPDGRYAAQGRPDESLLAELLYDPYFLKPPPKSTGREYFGEAFLAAFSEKAASMGVTDPHDQIATLTALTAASVYQAYARYVREIHPFDVLIVSGGGVHNRTLMALLERYFSPIPVRSVADYGLDPDAKEACCFAVLAHELLNGVPTNLPNVTGARRPTLLGKLCLPA